MARVTTEDCVVNVPNRFKLVMYASQRSRNITAGAELTLDRDNDKNPVVALREIAEKSIDIEGLDATIIQSMQRHVEIDEPEEEEMDFSAIQQENLGETDGDSNTAADASPAKAESVVAEVAATDDKGDDSPKES